MKDNKMGNNSYLKITKIKCTSCGAELNVDNDTDVICDFCGNTTSVLKPVKISKITDKGIKSEDFNKYNNMVKILESAIVAGNYKEGYEYCNKALEISPESAEIWINKAICAFWLSSKKEVVEEEAREVITYLNVAKKYCSDKNIVEEASRSIANNLFNFAKYWLSQIMVTYSYYRETDRETENMKIFITNAGNYLTLFDVAFELYNDTEYLKEGIEELYGHGITKRKLVFNINSYAKLQQLEKIFLRKIEKIESDYDPPEKKGSCFIATATMGDYNHPTVLKLRMFRDDYLLSRKWGCVFIQLYYKWGPYPANLIAKSIVLKKLSYWIIVKPLCFVTSKFKERKQVM